ncbi:MAG: Protein containing DUF192 [Parcubacteria group bacterium GW2011_GWA2_47_8b]|uniref:Protein containing DUF192 n=3 Tax=Parcubacteria group TaxID=1794811 RepID=A0A0G1VF78_9BACT|nr:MAG: Protein containing DUF192 [Candidatus Giovannonibacteria bacterium GW2011_GWB1_47_6b]KKU85120.1 MAG: Protein containing DUF192 [Parcubacteria group bacterium GW2011_GWA2_47_8b]OGY65074.1 MAG: hypothetical protein A3E64_02230 [Candidatus Harrisonbacteria bacterium RIFCSPHIGHO2_12_FULL_48_16]OGY68306.1 MAG: hypothetical protein A2214_01455 [Candidatus Harrisonbacteria bacterium RIFOXYA1_FULL_48_8]
MKKILSAIGIFLVAALVAIITFLISGEKGKQLPTKALLIGDKTFNVEIADTIASRTRGLSGRGFLGEGDGMFFIFPYSAIQHFWMKGMKFPIDIIWISGDKVIGMVMGAEPEAGPDYEIYSSPEIADKVLEINAGLTQKFGIKTGDSIGISLGQLE